MLSLGELRSRLSAIGESTATPGLTGDDRHAELLRRLRQSERLGGGDMPGEVTAQTFVVPSLQQLTITELRERLTALGESTATPGLSGEARRQALMRRVVQAVCGTGGSDGRDDEDRDDALGALASAASVVREEPEESDEEQEDEEEQEVVAPVTTAPKFKPAPPPPPRKLPPAPQPLPVLAEPAVRQQAPPRFEPSAAEISALKKDLRRISNKRAIMVASKLSGSSPSSLLSFARQCIQLHIIRSNDKPLYMPVYISNMSLCTRRLEPRR